MVKPYVSTKITFVFQKSPPGGSRDVLGTPWAHWLQKWQKKPVLGEGFWSHFLSIFTQKLKKWTLKNDPFLEARFYCFFEIWTLFFNTNFKEFVTFPVLLEKVPTLTKHWQGRHKSRFRPCITDPNSGKCNQISSLGNTDLQNTSKFNFWSILDPQKAPLFRSGPVKVRSGQVRSGPKKANEGIPPPTRLRSRGFTPYT